MSILHILIFVFLFSLSFLSLFSLSFLLSSSSGVDIPESAKIVLLQEEKFKSYYGDLHYLLKEYDRIMTRILPQTSDLLRPHGNDLEYKLRPGMVTLTWTSMNIDAYKHHFQNGLQKLEELVIVCFFLWTWFF